MKQIVQHLTGLVRDGQNHLCHKKGIRKIRDGKPAQHESHQGEHQDPPGSFFKMDHPLLKPLIRTAISSLRYVQLLPFLQIPLDQRAAFSAFLQVLFHFRVLGIAPQILQYPISVITCHSCHLLSVHTGSGT